MNPVAILKGVLAGSAILAVWLAFWWFFPRVAEGIGRALFVVEMCVYVLAVILGFAVAIQNRRNSGL